MASSDVESRFPCSITIDTPFPTDRLATSALKAIQVDPELSPLVHRVLSVVQQQGEGQQEGGEDTKTPGQTQSAFALRADYRATTNRMLRVAVNSYMESLRLVVDVMGALDVDVLEEAAQGSNTTS